MSRPQCQDDLSWEERVSLARKTWAASGSFAQFVRARMGLPSAHEELVAKLRAEEASGEGRPPAGRSLAARSGASEPRRGESAAELPAVEAPQQGGSITPRNTPNEGRPSGATHRDHSNPALAERLDPGPLGGRGALRQLRPERLLPDGAAVRVVLVRVDYLVIAYRIALSEGTRTGLLARIQDSVDGPIRVDLCGPSERPDRFEARALLKRGGYLLSNATLHIRVELHAVEGWNVVVEFKGQQMAKVDADRARELARHFASRFGEVQGERARRVDLCADVAGWNLGRTTDLDRWVKPRRGDWGEWNSEALERLDKRKGFTGDHVSPAAHVYTQNHRVTGIELCPGSDLSATIYDKRAHLRHRNDPNLTALEEARWTEGGWDGESPIARVEFSIRGAVLAEMFDREGRNLRDGARLVENLDRIWSYCTDWMRLTVATNNRLDRCEIDPRWKVVQWVRFKHEGDSAAITRQRTRGKATEAQAFGATLSLVASHDCPILFSVPSSEEQRVELGEGELHDVSELGDGDEARYVDTLTDAECDASAREILRNVMLQGAELIDRKLHERTGSSRDKLRFVLTRTRAKQAHCAEVAA